jgi:hypothetical protein
MCCDCVRCGYNHLNYATGGYILSADLCYPCGARNYKSYAPGGYSLRGYVLCANNHLKNAICGHNLSHRHHHGRWYLCVNSCMNCATCGCNSDYVLYENNHKSYATGGYTLSGDHRHHPCQDSLMSYVTGDRKNGRDPGADSLMNYVIGDCMNYCCYYYYYYRQDSLKKCAIGDCNNVHETGEDSLKNCETGVHSCYYYSHLQTPLYQLRRSLLKRYLYNPTHSILLQ